MNNDTKKTSPVWVIAPETEEVTRDYFCMIPHLVNEVGLSVQAFRLYSWIKRRTGEYGKCFESSRKIAEACKMSTGSVTKAKRELKENGLIKIRKYDRGHGEFLGDEIRIVDIWDLNAKYYKEKYKKGGTQYKNTSTCSSDDSDGINIDTAPDNTVNTTDSSNETNKKHLITENNDEKMCYEESNSTNELTTTDNISTFFKNGGFNNLVQRMRS